MKKQGKEILLHSHFTCPATLSWMLYKASWRGRIKTSLDDSPQYSILKINVLETLDTAFYKVIMQNTPVETSAILAIIEVAVDTDFYKVTINQLKQAQFSQL